MMGTNLVARETALRVWLLGARRMRLVQKMRIFTVVLRTERMKIFTKRRTKRMTQTAQKNIRFTPEELHSDLVYGLN